MEAVLCSRIDPRFVLHFVRIQRSFEVGPIAGDAGIHFPVMQSQLGFDFCGIFGCWLRAVVGGARRQIRSESHCERIRDASAIAETSRADLACAIGPVL